MENINSKFTFINWLSSFVKLWRSTDTAGRVFLVIGTFGALSSIMGLSGNILKWRGVIAAGLEFYREFITGPLVKLFSLIGVDLLPVDADILILWSVCASSIIRSMITDHRTLLNIYEAYRDTPDPRLAYKIYREYIISLLLISFIVVLCISINNKLATVASVLVILLYGYFYLTYRMWVRIQKSYARVEEVHRNKKSLDYQKSLVGLTVERSWSILHAHIGPPIIAVLALVIISAINNGLTMPLPK